MKIKFLDIQKINQKYNKEFMYSLDNFLKKGYFILGDQVSKFEDEFSEFCNSKFCVGVGNGLDALFLVLKAWNIQKGDEVIVPSNTYIATWLAVSNIGATPVPVEPNILTSNIDPKNIRKKITKKTKAIIPVHLYGQTVDMDPIKEVIADTGIKILEDAAQGHGAKYKNKYAGNLGHAAAFSFYPTKNLGALGDGGAVTTNCKYTYNKVKELRNYGSNVKYYNESKGFNSRLDEIQAAFLRIKLRNLNNDNIYRKKIAEIYNERIISKKVIKPFVEENCDSVWHLYVIKVESREDFIKYLDSKNIQHIIHYPIPPYKQNAYKDEFIKPDFPIADKLSSNVISLPIGPHLEMDEVDYVVETINNY